MSYALPEITWNPPSLSFQAFPGAPIPLNFSSNQNVNGVSVNISKQLNGLIYLVTPTTNIFQGNQALHETLVILPSVSSGWHNGTVTFLANGSPLQQSLYLNLLVPPTVTSVQQLGSGVSIATVVSPSHSPFFNNTYNMAQYGIFENGTYMPIRFYYDVFTNTTIAQFTKHANNTATTSEKPSTPMPSNTSQESKTISIPAWIKLTAGWWAHGHVGDSDFVQGIQYLVQQNIIKNAQTSQYTSSQSSQIPQWIKKDAGWWASGQISNDEFVKGIQYLIDNGIITV